MKLPVLFTVVFMTRHASGAFAPKSTAFRRASNTRLFAGNNFMPSFLTGIELPKVDTDAITKAAGNIDTAAVTDTLGKISDSSLSKLMTEENKANAKDKFAILKGNFEKQTGGLKDLVSNEDGLKKIATNLKDSAGDGGDAGAKFRLMQENFNKMKGDASGLKSVDPGEKLRLMKENLENVKRANIEKANAAKAAKAATPAKAPESVDNALGTETIVEPPPVVEGAAEATDGATGATTETPAVLENSVSWTPVKAATSDFAETLRSSFMANAAGEEGIVSDGSVYPLASSNVHIGDATAEVANIGSMNLAADMVGDNTPLIIASIVAVVAAMFSPRPNEV